MRIPEHDLPLFPLNAVLFPRMALQLRVFEPRYLELIHRCQDEEIGFGVPLIKSGEEVGTTAEPYSVGTIARILEVKQEEEQLDVVIMGVVRFRILQTYEEHSYLSGDIERWEEEMGDVKALPRVTHVAHQIFKEYVADLMELAGTQKTLDQDIAPADPQILSYVIAVNLQVPNEEKQLLLEMETVEARLRHEVTLLEQERAYLQRLKATPDYLPKNDDESFSKN